MADTSPASASPVHSYVRDDGADVPEAAPHTLVLQAADLMVDLDTWEDPNDIVIADEVAAADNEDELPHIGAAIASELASVVLIAEPSAKDCEHVGEPEPVLHAKVARSSEPEDLQIARRVAAIDIESGHLFDEGGSLYRHDVVREMQRLTLIAEDEGAYEHEAPRVARMAFAVKHGLEAVLPQYARGYGRLAAIIRGTAEDGEISADDRKRIREIAAYETAKVTGPVHNAPDVLAWQETFDDVTLSALAVDQACYEAARVKDMNRAAKAVGIAIAAGEHDYSGAHQISVAAAKSAEALRASDAEHQAAIIAELMVSPIDAERVRGLLALRVLLEGQGSTSTKADLADHVVAKLSDERLAKLDPATAARLMLALQRATRFQAVTPLGRSVSLMPERGEFDGTSALPSPQDARFWNADLHEGPLPDHRDAVARLREHGPTHMSYYDKNGVFEVRYTPRVD